MLEMEGCQNVLHDTHHYPSLYICIKQLPCLGVVSIIIITNAGQERDT